MHIVHPARIELASSEPESDILSIELRVQKLFERDIIPVQRNGLIFYKWPDLCQLLIGKIVLQIEF